MFLVLSAFAAAQDPGLVKEITIRGAKRISVAAIKSFMKVREGQILNLKALDEDRNQIYAMGWFSKVAYSKTLLQDNNWQVVFDVAENEILREVAVEGNKAIKTEDILKLIQFLPPKGTKEEDLRPVNRTEFGPSFEAIQRLYETQGFFGRVEDFGPDPYSPGTWRLLIRETMVNSVTVEGFTNTRNKVFNRLIRTKPGDPYSRFVWEQDALRILNTQWFEGVTPSQPSLAQVDDGSVDLKMKLNDGRTGNFVAGVTLNPANSLAGTLSYSDANFLGTGQSVSANWTQATVGAVGASVSLDYSNPFYDAKDSIFRFSVYDRVQFRFLNNNFGGGGNVTPTDQLYSERRTGGSLGFTRPVSDRQSYTFSTRFEKIRLPNAGTTTTTGQNFIQQEGEVGVLGLSSITNKRDLDFDPARGTFFRLDIEPGYSVINKVANGGTTSNPGDDVEGRFGFFRVGFDYRSYRTPSKKRRTADDLSREVYAFRLRGGTVQGTIPFFEQYFAGGNDSIRGYNEDRFWGKNLLFASFEYRKPIQDQFSLVTFLDAGGAWGGYGGFDTNGFTQTDGFKLRLGYGVGLRLRTPIGPVRLDFAFNNEGGSRPHFMIGNSF